MGKKLTKEEMKLAYYPVKTKQWKKKKEPNSKYITRSNQNHRNQNQNHVVIKTIDTELNWTGKKQRWKKNKVEFSSLKMLNEKFCCILKGKDRRDEWKLKTRKYKMKLDKYISHERYQYMALVYLQQFIKSNVG